MSLPYDYYPAVLYAIDLIGQGHTRTSACDASNISLAIFDKYVNQHVELQEMYKEMEERGYDAMAEMLPMIDRLGPFSQSDPKMAKIISDNIKWLLSKRRTKKYGDKLEVTHNITADKAITDALTAGKNRALNAHKIVDVEFSDVTEDEILADPAFR